MTYTTHELLNQSEIRRRNRVLFNMWRKQNSDVRLSKAQRGMAWKKFALVNALTKIDGMDITKFFDQEKHFHEEYVIHTTGVRRAKWMALKQWSINWVGNDHLRSIMSRFFYQTAWLANLRFFFRVKRDFALAARATSFFRTLIGNDYLTTTYTKESFIKAIRPKYQRLILANLASKKSSFLGLVEIFPYTVEEFQDYCKMHPVMDVLFEQMKFTQKLLEFQAGMSWTGTLLNGFPLELFHGLNSEFFGSRWAKRAVPKMMEMMRLNNFIIGFIGGGKNEIQFTYSISPQLSLILRFEAYDKIVVESRANVKPSILRFARTDRVTMSRMLHTMKLNELLR